mmetsp:Transcript_19189/g.54199  ORF Transcript_19189/g.54199 Transcript_19189/m.54199 type:complete len:281 (-) Transcript_19189:294-1136(-)
MPTMKIPQSVVMQPSSPELSRRSKSSRTPSSRKGVSCAASLLSLKSALTTLRCAADTPGVPTARRTQSSRRRSSALRAMRIMQRESALHSIKASVARMSLAACASCCGECSCCAPSASAASCLTLSVNGTSICASSCWHPPRLSSSSRTCCKASDQAASPALAAGHAPWLPSRAALAAAGFRIFSARSLQLFPRLAWPASSSLSSSSLFGGGTSICSARSSAPLHSYSSPGPAWQSASKVSTSTSEMGRNSPSLFSLRRGAELAIDEAKLSFTKDSWSME